MFLIPYKKLVFNTPYGKDYVKSKIEEYTEDGLIPINSSNKIFQGKVSNSSFRLVRIKKEKSKISYNPMAFGSIEQIDSGTVIRAFLIPQPIVLIIVFGLMLFLLQLNFEEEKIYITGLLILHIVGYYFEYLPETKRFEEVIRSVFESKMEAITQEFHQRKIEIRVESEKSDSGAGQEEPPPVKDLSQK